MVFALKVSFIRAFRSVFVCSIFKFVCVCVGIYIPPSTGTFHFMPAQNDVVKLTVISEICQFAELHRQ